MSRATPETLVLCSGRDGESVVYAQAQLELRQDGGAPEWVHLIRGGTFMLRDGRGPYRLDAPDQVIRASVQRVAGGEPPIDYDHQSDFGAVPGVGQRAPAAGWIKEMQARADGIWARVEWTEAARRAIEAKEYRFLSPAFTTTREGEVTAVLRASLVNVPAMELKALAKRDDQMDEFLKQLRAELGLKEDADQATVLACVKARQAGATQLATLAKELGLVDAADPAKLDKPADVVTAAKADRQALADTAKVLQLNASDAETVSKGVGELVKASAGKGGGTETGKPDPSQYVPIEHYNDLAQRVEKMETASAQQTAQQKVDAAVTAGKITPAQKEWALEFAAANPQSFDTFVAAQPVICSAGGELVSGAKPADGGGGKLSAEEKEVCARMQLSEDDFIAARDGKELPSLAASKKETGK